MKIGIIVSTNDADTCWNAFRFANFCLNSKDEAKVFLIGKGVEYQQISSAEFNIVEQAEKLLGAGGKIFACGTCLKQRNSSGSKGSGMVGPPSDIISDGGFFSLR